MLSLLVVEAKSFFCFDWMLIGMRPISTNAARMRATGVLQEDKSGALSRRTFNNASFNSVVTEELLALLVVVVSSAAKVAEVFHFCQQVPKV
jgi:hypothetical protein